MQKFILFLSALVAMQTAWAEVNLDPLVNKVTLNLQTEQWVTTKTALVSVGINAAVADQGIEKIQAQVMQKLSQLAAGEWHIVSFNRQQDKSGLESIQINAEARLVQTELGNLRNKAKAMSKPGETFTIDNVQFTPSQEELMQANAAMRVNLYTQAKSEIDTLNTQYPNQKFYLHRIDFSGMQALPVPMTMNAMGMSKVASSAPPLAVGNRQQLQAIVELAAMPDVVVQRLTIAKP